MLKIIGIVFLVASGTLIGYIKSLQHLNYISFLRQYMKLILNFKTEINYSQKTIIQIIKEYSSELPLKPYLNKCILLLDDHPFEQAWKMAFSNLQNNLGASSEEENIIKNFASGLGSSDIENQINYCKYNLEIIKPYLEREIENKNKKEKLPVILGLSSSLILSIMLI